MKSVSGADDEIHSWTEIGPVTSTSVQRRRLEDEHVGAIGQVRIRRPGADDPGCLALIHRTVRHDAAHAHHGGMYFSQYGSSCGSWHHLEEAGHRAADRRDRVGWVERVAWDAAVRVGCVGAEGATWVQVDTWC